MNSINETTNYDVPRIYINTLDGNGAILKKSDGYTEAQIQVVDTVGNIINAYGFDKKITESECVAELMKLYHKLTK